MSDAGATTPSLLAFTPDNGFLSMSDRTTGRFTVLLDLRAVEAIHVENGVDWVFHLASTAGRPMTISGMGTHPVQTLQEILDAWRRLRMELR